MSSEKELCEKRNLDIGRNVRIRTLLAALRSTGFILRWEGARIGFKLSDVHDVFRGYI